MKKYFIMLCVILTVVFTTQVMALDASIGAGVGLLTEKEQKSVVAYSVAFDMPIVTKADSSYTVYSITDYTYADREQANGEMAELSIIRTMLMYERSITNWMDVGLGTGVWKIIDTKGEDPEHMALRFQLGFNVFGIHPSLSQDIVRINGGNDMYYSTINYNFF